ncbi:MAG: DNA-3-methyladenine glycosylase I [Victivallales bacterium]
MKSRCPWCEGEKIYVDYHDREWGVPVHDDHDLFEKLILDGAQAGLSWLTILKKREGYRRAFDGFDAEKIAGYSCRDISRLLADAGIVRNRLKIEAAIRNARGYLQIRDEFGSFDKFMWRYVDYAPKDNSVKTLSEIKATSRESDMMSKDLKKRGFNFVGSTICYAYMQAVGMVNDHLVSCFRYKEIRRMSRNYSFSGK